MVMKILGISFLVSRALIFEAVKNDQVTIVRYQKASRKLIRIGCEGAGVGTRVGSLVGTGVGACVGSGVG